jgi:hypothetical protein
MIALPLKMLDRVSAKVHFGGRPPGGSLIRPLRSGLCVGGKGLPDYAVYGGSVYRPNHSQLTDPVYVTLSCSPTPRISALGAAGRSLNEPPYAEAIDTTGVEVEAINMKILTGNGKGLSSATPEAGEGAALK